MGKMYGDDGQVFDKEILLRLVKGIEIQWMLAYANSPDIILLGDKEEELSWLRTDLYDELPILGNSSKHIYYANHPSGFVHYFTHSGREGVDEGGFGGATFTTTLRSGQTKHLRGPWSSRASVVNMVVLNSTPFIGGREIADVVFHGRWRISAAIKIEALVFLFNHFQMPYYLYRFVHKDGTKEGSSVYVSKAPTYMWKEGHEVPDNGPNRDKGYDLTQYNYQLLYSPKE